MSKKDEPSTEEILSKLIWIESAMKKKAPKTNTKGNTGNEDEKNVTKNEYPTHDPAPKSQNSNARSSNVYRTGVVKNTGGENIDKPLPDDYEENKTKASVSKPDPTLDDEESSLIYEKSSSRPRRDKPAYINGRDSVQEPYRDDEESSTKGSKGYSYIVKKDGNKTDDDPSNNSKQDKSPKNSRGPRPYPATPNKETKFQMIRNADSPCADDTVSLAKLIKYTKRLKFTLYELKDEVAGSVKYKNSVDDLISKVEWFLKDLDQSDGSCEQTFILLEKYDIYRSAYYCIRKKIDTIKITDRKDTSYYTKETGDEDNEQEANEENGYKEDDMMGNGENKSLKSGNNKYKGSEEECMAKCRLYECPGVTDVRKGSNNKKYQYWENSSKYLSWCGTLKKYCCICFPCIRN